MSISKEYFTVVVVGADSKPAKQLEPLVFSLRDGEEYSLHLTNHHQTLRANATVFIDGKEVVCVRVNNRSFVAIERPHEMAAKFTFVKASNDRLALRNQDLGVIRIDFALEVPRVGVVETDGVDVSDGPSEHRGMTVFGRHSTQQYREAQHLPVQYVTTIRAMLVTKA